MNTIFPQVWVFFYYFSNYDFEYEFIISKKSEHMNFRIRTKIAWKSVKLSNQRCTLHISSFSPQNQHHKRLINLASKYCCWLKRNFESALWAKGKGRTNVVRVCSFRVLRTVFENDQKVSFSSFGKIQFFGQKSYFKVKYDATRNVVKCDFFKIFIHHTSSILMSLLKGIWCESKKAKIQIKKGFIFFQIFSLKNCSKLSFFKCFVKNKVLNFWTKN